MNKKLLNIVQLLLTVALVVFIVIKAGDFFKKVDWQVISSNWPVIFAAAGLFVVGYIFLARHWLLMCRLVDKNTSSKQWLAYFASQPYKYLPTSLFTFSSRATFAAKFGMSLKKSTEAQLIENVNLIGTALGIGITLLVLINSFLLGLGLVAAQAILCLLLWKQKSLTIPKVNITLDLRKWIISLSVVTAGWVIIGLGFLLMVMSLENRFEPVLAIAANNLATGLGITAIFAPGGIGVRELVFSYLGFASGTILIWRLTTFTVDIVVGIWAAWAISRSQQKSSLS